MKKETLRKLRTLRATPAMINRAQQDKPVCVIKKHWWDHSEYEHWQEAKYAYYLRVQCLEGFLKIAVFTTYSLQRGVIEPSFEIFINPHGDEYITRYWDNGIEKWTDTMIRNLNIIGAVDHNGRHTSQSSYLYACEQEAWINPEGKKTLHSYLGKEKSTYRKSGVVELIMQYQENCKRLKRRQAEERECARWDNALKIVPDEPKGLQNWVRRKVFKPFIFYKTGDSYGRCSACENEIPLPVKPRHNLEYKCPHCKRLSIMQNTNIMSKKLWTENERFQVIQQAGDVLILRAYEAREVFKNKNTTKPKIYIKEYARKIYTNGTVNDWRYGDYKNKTTRWIPATYDMLFDGHIYPKTHITLQRSGIPMILKKHMAIPLDDYIKYENEYPVVESFAKIGLFAIVVWVVNNNQRYRYGSAIDLNSRSATEALKIDKARLKRLVSMDGWIHALMWLQYEKNANTQYPDKMIRDFDDNNINPRDFVDIWAFIKWKQHSVTPIYNYLKKQQKICGRKLGDVFAMYRDYLGMAEQNKCRMDLEQVQKPKDLKAAHDHQIKLSKQEEISRQAKELKKKYKNLEKNIPCLSKYEYKDSKFMIVAPKRVEDIVAESHILGLCIHTCDFYFERINTKESFILFLRKTDHPDNPWYTLEVEPGGNIRQKRTTGDNQESDLDVAIPFLKKWQSRIVKTMNDQDKELAAEADRKRRKNYKDIRINNKRVWHGRHQGELLADVLEADFMAAI